MLVSKLHSGTSKTKAGPGGLVRVVVPLFNLLTSMCDFVPCDRIVQRAYSERNPWSKARTNNPNMAPGWNRTQVTLHQLHVSWHCLHLFNSPCSYEKSILMLINSKYVAPENIHTSTMGFFWEPHTSGNCNKLHTFPWKFWSFRTKTPPPPPGNSNPFSLAGAWIFSGTAQWTFSVIQRPFFKSIVPNGHYEMLRGQILICPLSIP